VRASWIIFLFAGICAIAAGADLTVEQAVEMAVEKGETVLIKWGELQKAEYAYKEAKTGALPSLSVETSASWMTDPPEGIKVEAGALSAIPLLPSEDMIFVEDAEKTYFSISFILNQPIFTWLKIKNGIELAAISRDLARWELSRTRRKVRRDVAVTYFGVVLAGLSHGLLGESLALIEEILQDSLASYEEGLVSYQAVLEVKARLAAARSRHLEAEESIASGLETLSFYTGLKAGEIEPVSSFSKEPPAYDYEKIKEEALDLSIEREILLAKAKMAETDLAVQKGEGMLKPDISLIVQWDIEGQHIPWSEEDWTGSWKENLRFTLGARLPLFDSLRSHWGIHGAEKNVEIARMALGMFEKALALQVRQGIQKHREAYFLLLEKEAALELAEEKFKNAAVSYENEMITRGEEKEARLLLASSRLSCFLASYRLEIALIEMEYLVGRSL
jgi:outer membrane protein TolC